MTLRDLLVISGLCLLTEDADEAFRLTLKKEIIHLYGEDVFERLEAIEASNEESEEVMLQILRSLAVDQEFLDVKAGIPARDAEIAALRKEIETLKATMGAEPVAVPKGWKLVPIEPTDAMLLAGYSDVHDTEIWWSLMLNAAPAAPVATPTPAFSVGVHGVGVIDDNPSALAVYFNAAPNNDDIRALHEIVTNAPVAAQSQKSAISADWRFVEARECSSCGHVGINDSSSDNAACSECDWIGPMPEKDRCQGCERESVMTAACPKCGERYNLLASATIQAPAQPELIRFDYVNADGQPDSKMLTHDEMRERYAALAQPEDDSIALDRLADYIADTWQMDKKYGLEEICQRLHAMWPGEFMPAAKVDRSPEMQRKPVDESPNLQGQQQPVSGADELPAERVLIDGTVYELPSAVAAELLRLHLEILGSEQAQSSGNSVQLDHLPDAAQMIEPSGNSGELPDAVRVPLDSIHADAVYLLSRVKQETLSIHDAAQSIRSRIEATCAALAQQDADKVDAEQWISVNERLPEIHEWRAGSIAGISDAVLTIDEDDPDTMTVQHLRKGGQGDLTTLYWDHGDSPTHWRPAPSLPGIDAARKEKA